MTRPATSGAALAALLGRPLEGPSKPITRLAPPEGADAESVVVAQSLPEAAGVQRSPLGLLVVPEDLDLETPHPLVRVPDARLAFARLSAALDSRPTLAAAIHPSASIDPTARLAEGVRIGAVSVIGADARIGPGCVIGPGTVIGAGSTLGANCLLHANVTLYDGVHVGDRAILHSGVVLGGDGFGYARGPHGAEKIHHNGGVRLGSDIEIGTNSVVDRGTLADTVIGDRTKIDSLVLVAHNVRIGQDCILAGGCALAGSVVLEQGVVLLGATKVKDHVRIGAAALVNGGTVVTRNIPAGEHWAGNTAVALPYKEYLRRHRLLGRLEQIWQAIRALGRASS